MADEVIDLRAERLAVSTLARMNDISTAGGSNADRLAFLRDTFDTLLNDATLTKWEQRAERGFNPEESEATDAYWQGVRAVCAELRAIPVPHPRWFPIQGGPKILWGVIEPHERQADANHGQTLERLAQRGGLSPCEAVAVLEDRDWRPMPDAAALARLRELNAASEYQRGFNEAAAVPQRKWEGDLPTEHLNRCKLRDNLLYADIFNHDGSHRAVWRCHKREGHDGPCSSHNDCGVMNGGVVCGLLPGHSGPHAWETRIAAGAVPQTGTAGR
jgi:hypothetical protein